MDSSTGGGCRKSASWATSGSKNLASSSKFRPKVSGVSARKWSSNWSTKTHLPLRTCDLLHRCRGKRGNYLKKIRPAGTAPTVEKIGCIRGFGSSDNNIFHSKSYPNFRDALRWVKLQGNQGWGKGGESRRDKTGQRG